MSLRSNIFALATLFACIAAQIASADQFAIQTIFVDSDFENEIPNTSNGVPLAGYATNRTATLTDTFSSNGLMDGPNYVYNTTVASGRGVTVFASGQAGHTSQSAGIYSHPFIYASGSNRGRMQVAAPGPATPLDGTTEGTHIFSFDMSLPSTYSAGFPQTDTSTWSIVPGISLQSNYGPTTPFGRPGTDLFKVRFSDGDLVLDHLSGTQTLVSSFNPNQVYSIYTVSDMDADTFTISVDGSPVGGDFDMLASTSAGANQGIGGYLVRGGATTTGGDGSPDQFTMYIDNIFLATTISYVPEPGSGSMLILGLMGLIRCRRRRLASR